MPGQSSPQEQFADLHREESQLERRLRVVRREKDALARAVLSESPRPAAPTAAAALPPLGTLQACLLNILQGRRGEPTSVADLRRVAERLGQYSKTDPPEKGVANALYQMRTRGIPLVRRGDTWALPPGDAS